MSYTPGRFTDSILRRNESVKRPGSVYPRPTYRNCFLLKQLASDGDSGCEERQLSDVVLHGFAHLSDIVLRP